ncbi:MAG: hypothetical protein NT157_05045 [Candidatus Micrarchaeota archaeon]|nr:hypothetical protein [Candidatus Micrarchaeota archaeon]
MAAASPTQLGRVVRWLDSQQEAAGGPNVDWGAPQVHIDEKNTPDITLYYSAKLAALRKFPSSPSKGQVRAFMQYASRGARQKLARVLSRWSGQNFRYLRNYTNLLLHKELTDTKHILNNLLIAQAIHKGDVEAAAQHISRAVGLVQWAARRELRNSMLPTVVTGSPYIITGSPLHKTLSHPITGAYRKFSKNTWLSFSTSATASFLRIQPKLRRKKQIPLIALAGQELQFKTSLLRVKQNYHNYLQASPAALRGVLPTTGEIELALLNNDQKLLQTTVNYLRFVPLPPRLLEGGRKPPYVLVNQLSETINLRARMDRDAAQKVAESIKNK